MSVFLLIVEACKGKLKSLNVSIEYKCEISVPHIKVITLRFFICIRTSSSHIPHTDSALIAAIHSSIILAAVSKDTRL